MTWKATLLKSTTDPNICTITGQWTDSAKKQSFTYSEERVVQTSLGLGAFVTNAKNAFAKQQASKSQLEDAETAIEARLNT